MGPIVLDWAEDDLEELEIRACHRSTGNGDLMAAQTFQTILVEVVSAKRARATAREFDSKAGKKHGCRQRPCPRYSIDSIGKPRSRHAPNPPASGRTRIIPNCWSCCATRALVASFGQVQ